jgi:BirA family biotin operon repressor/biotin-[acetyl-CoA-carboxylase] ligase
MNITLLTFDTIDSTNTEALKQARLGAEEGVCIVARQQTAGRGRHGRTWVSEKDAGLYFSIVLRPKIDAQFLPLITLMTGVAVHDAIAEFGIDADIKWVNDLLVNEKKICGILAETTETNRGLAVVVGIGVNLSSSNFPPEIANSATSIEEMLILPAVAGGTSRHRGPEIKAELMERLPEFLSYFYNILNSENGPAEIIEEWRRRSSYFSGKRVQVALENKVVTGVTDGLEPNGAIRLKTDDGNILAIQAGDVERLRSES